MKDKGLKAKKEKYTVEVKYSPESIKNKLVRFTTPCGESFEISADELISIISTQVNSEVLSASFVESDRINVVEVGRQITCVLDRDLKKGEVININYSHPYPIEFALIEEAWKIAQLKKDTKVTELTVPYIEEVKRKLKPEMEEYMRSFYKSFKNLNLNKNMTETNEEKIDVTKETVEEVKEKKR